MTTAKFACSFRGRGSTETERRVRLGRVAATKAKLPEHGHLDPVEIHDATPGAATCFLQLWEADHFSAHYVLQNFKDAPKPRRANRLIASLPGAVVKAGSGHKFVSIGPAAEKHTFDRLNGLLRIRVDSDAGAPVTFLLPMPDFEGVSELVGAIKASATDESLETFPYGKPHQLHNVGAAVLRQIQERGGVNVSISADYPYNRAGGTDRRSTKRLSQDREFRRQAEDMINQLPAFCLKDGKIQFGFYDLVGNRADIGDNLQEVRDAIKAEFELDEAPKVATLGIYAHGKTTAMMLPRESYNAGDGGITVGTASSLVADLKPHLSDAVVVALFACNTGRRRGKPSDDQKAFGFPRSKGSSKVGAFGRPFIAEELGLDSLAWTLNRELIRQGIPEPTVWAHTVAAHTTRNFLLRVFSSRGAADVTSVLFEARRPNAAARGAYVNKAGTDAALKNLVRNMHLQSALYLPWEWAGGSSATTATPGFNADAQADALAVFDEVRRIAGGVVGASEPLDVLFDSSNQFVTGKASGASEPTLLSENFSVEDFDKFAQGLPLPVALVRDIQTLRYRSKTEIQIAGVVPRLDTEGALGAVLRVPVSKLQKVFDTAHEMTTTGFFINDVATVPPTLDTLQVTGPEIPGPT